MADAMDSKSIMGDHVWVQVPPSAPIKNDQKIGRFSYSLTTYFFIIL